MQIQIETMDWTSLSLSLSLILWSGSGISYVSVWWFRNSIVNSAGRTNSAVEWLIMDSSAISILWKLAAAETEQNWTEGCLAGEEENLAMDGLDVLLRYFDDGKSIVRYLE